MTEHQAYEKSKSTNRKRMLDDQDHATQPMKKLINETNETVFNNWISEWKLKTLKYTSVDLSLHSSTEGKPVNLYFI